MDVMDDKTYGALKRIVKEVEAKRKAECLMKDCIVNAMIGGDDIQLVNNWINDNVNLVRTNVPCDCASCNDLPF